MKYLLSILMLIVATYAQETTAKTYDFETNKLILDIKIKKYSKQKMSFSYFSPSGKRLGSKMFEFPDNCPWSPNVTLTNLMYDQASEVSIANGKVWIKNTVQKKESREEFDKACSMVWDLGIHRFILDHWEQLKKGSVDLNILAFTDEKSFEFVAKMDKNFKVNLEPKNTLIKMFVGEIYFQYNESKKLLEYVGKLDMKDAEGKSPQVRTVYE